MNKDHVFLRILSSSHASISVVLYWWRLLLLLLLLLIIYIGYTTSTTCAAGRGYRHGRWGFPSVGELGVLPRMNDPVRYYVDLLRILPHLRDVAVRLPPIPSIQQMVDSIPFHYIVRVSDVIMLFGIPNLYRSRRWRWRWRRWLELHRHSNTLASSYCIYISIASTTDSLINYYRNHPVIDLSALRSNEIQKW